MENELFTLRGDVLDFAADNYGTIPDAPWPKYRWNQVLRHSNNKKWYGLLMRVKYRVLGIEKDGETDVLDLKCTPMAREILVGEGTALPAYHMNKEKWISLLLDGTVPAETIFPLLEESYELTK
ncbi:MAG: MmcQ/YjbR family DNA-binding protein [Ruminococcus sp.]|nr:MmcQ/YjbR family DNA-binding protein [Ruminococcus sp.]